MTKVTDENEIVLYGVPYPITGNVQVQTISQLPAKITIGDASRGDQQVLSEWAIGDLSGGIGRVDLREKEDIDRFADGFGMGNSQDWLRLGPQVQTLGPTFSTVPAKMAWYGGELYVLGNEAVLRYNTSTGAWDDVSPIVDATWQDAITYKNLAGVTRFYVASQTRYAYSASGDPGSWTTKARAACWLAVFDGKLISANETDVSFSTDGETWQPVVTHGMNQRPNALATMRTADGQEETIVLAFDDGLYYLDFWTGRLSRVVDLSTGAYEHHGRGLLVYRDEAFIPAQYQLLRMSGSTVINIGLTASGNIWPHEARIRCLCPVGPDVLAGAGNAVMRWNGRGWWPQFKETSGDQVLAMASDGTMLESATRNKVYWVAGASGTYYVHYAELSATGIDPLDDATFPFGQDEEIVTGWFDGIFSNWDKVLVAVEVEGRRMTAQETVSVYYRLNNADAWTLLGTANEDGLTVLPFAGSNGVTCRRVQLRFISHQRGEPGYTPVWRATLRYMLAPDILYGYRVPVDCSREYKGRTPAELEAALLQAAAVKTFGTLAWQGETEKLVRVAALQGNSRSGRAKGGRYLLSLVEVG
jgi:hypothetical protein